MIAKFAPEFLGAAPRREDFKTDAEFQAAAKAYQKKAQEERAKLQAAGTFAPGYKEYMTEYESRMRDSAEAARIANSFGYILKKNWPWFAAGAAALILFA